MPASAAAEPGAAGPALLVDRLTVAFPGVGTVLDLPHLDLPGGSLVAIEGPSGSGKTSLLHVLAGLERPAGGTVRWRSAAGPGPGSGEVSVWSLPDAARDAWRRRSVGLVFQDIHLLDGFSALGNVTLPVLFEQVRVPADLRGRGRALLARMGIDAADRPVSVMSRGERQRVALARALLRNPPLLLADEPTASLDRTSAAAVSNLLVDAARAAGATLVVTSHDPVLLDRMPTRLRIDAGRLVTPA